MSTTAVENVSYAFYLKYKSTLEKKWYSASPDVLFDAPLKSGAYQATFFYKEGANKVSYAKSFYLSDSGGIVEPLPTVVSDSYGYRIVNYDIGSPITFVVFNTTGTDKDTKPFGLDFLLGCGYNVIACLQNDNQYQELSFGDFRQIVSPLVLNKRVFLYGSSLGGYCAVYYAGAVNGTVIAAAPRNSAHPQVIARNSKSKFKDFNYTHVNIGKNSLTNNKVFVFYDPEFPEDVFFINNLVKSAYPDAWFFECPHSGHPVLFHLSKTRQLKDIIDNIVNERYSHIEIDVMAESVFTDMGKAEHCYRSGDYLTSIKYAEKVLLSNEVNEKRKAKFYTLIEKSKKKIE